MESCELKEVVQGGSSLLCLMLLIYKVVVCINRALPTKAGRTEIAGDLENSSPRGVSRRKAYRVSWEEKRMLGSGNSHCRQMAQDFK